LAEVVMKKAINRGGGFIRNLRESYYTFIAGYLVVLKGLIVTSLNNLVVEIGYTKKR